MFCMLSDCGAPSQLVFVVKSINRNFIRVTNGIGASFLILITITNHHDDVRNHEGKSKSVIHVPLVENALSVYLIHAQRVI